MIPDYNTFIRFQDKRNIFFIYLISLILLGFYWKNADFTLSREDALPIGGILSLVLYSCIADLRAYWAYKCGIKNVDVTCFLKKDEKQSGRILFSPFIVIIFSVVLFSGIAWAAFSLLSPGKVLLIIMLTGPMIIWAIYALLRPVYIGQILSSARDSMKYKRLSGYLTIAVTLSVIMNLLTIAPLRHREQFSFYGNYFTIESVITMLVLCVIVLAINIMFLRFSKRYIFLGHLFMNEVNQHFSVAIPLRSFNAKPLWLRLILLCAAELVWITFVALLTTLVGWSLWFEVYFFLCYLPCLGYYALHAWWKWHDDFMMACDMCLRWDEISKQNALW